MINYKSFQSILISFYSFFFGGIDSLFISLLIIIIIDYITGICKGIYNRNLSSKKSIQGIIKKIGYILIVILATLCDRLLNDSSMAIRTLVIYFFISNEAISILENWASIGLPLPKRLQNIFEKIKNE